MKIFGSKWGAPQPAHAPEPTTAPPATAALPGDLLLFGPHVDSPVRLAGSGSKRRMQRAVLRPIDLTNSHGLVVKAENIQRLAATYDPSFEMAMLNFDHEWGGPAHGHCLRLYIEGDLLWSDWGQLSDAAVHGMESGQWPRVSCEFWTSHPQTKDWYFTGLALLGSKSPAVPGLPPERWMMSRPVYRLISAQDAVPGTSEPVDRGESLHDSAGGRPASAGEQGAPARVEPSAAGDLATPSLAPLTAAELAAGLTLEEAARLEAKYPTSFPSKERAEGGETAESIARDIARLKREIAADRAGLARDLEAAGKPPVASATALSAAEVAAGLTPEEAARLEAKYPHLAGILAAERASPGSSADRSARAPRSASPLSSAEAAAGLTLEQAARLEAKYPTARLGSETP